MKPELNLYKGLRFPCVALDYFIKRSIQGIGISALLASTLMASSLENRSPFLPPDHNKKEVAPPPVVKNGPLSREIEFRGVVQMNGAYQLSLFNKAEQKGYWVKVGENKEGISVSAYDPTTMAVTINKSGRSERLSLMESTDSPMPVQTSTATSPSQAKSTMPPGLEKASGSSNTNKRLIPRRRVILPKK